MDDLRRLSAMSILLLAGVVAAADEADVHRGGSPYSGEESRTIKALSAAEVEALQNGDGMGLAKAAELNGYPGPRHVLDLATQLGLTAEQRSASTALYEDMRHRAIRLGRALLEAERELDRLFSSHEADSASVEDVLARIAVLQSRLRQVHLEAHLRQTDILDERQISRYAMLRGYHEGHREHE